ncbi:MAG TPA: SpoIID/LytB domain-containing protein [Clostridiales bacterium]|nr:SpoIID/LytB domain-containing protein [Clostridiales bacterium]
MEVLNFNIIDLSNGLEEKLNFNDYLSGIISATTSEEDLDYEALKAYAIISRTYAIHNILLLLDSNPNKDIFTTLEIGLTYTKNINNQKILNAINDTKGEVIIYDDSIIMPVFFNNGSGFTRNAIEAWGIDLPYLVGTTSKQDISSSNYIHVSEYSYIELFSKLNSYFIDTNISESSLMNDIIVVQRDSIGYVTEVQIGDMRISGEEFSYALELNSSNFYFEEYNEKIRFICTGMGHGVGLSIYGANIMAKEGFKCHEILHHYYKNTEITNLYKNKNILTKK